LKGHLLNILRDTGETDFDIIRSNWGYVFWEPYAPWSYYFDLSFKKRLYTEPVGPWFSDFTYIRESIHNSHPDVNLAEKVATMFYHNYGKDYIMHCIEHEPEIYRKGSFHESDWYFLYLHSENIDDAQFILGHHVDDVDNRVILLEDGNTDNILQTDYDQNNPDGKQNQSDRHIGDTRSFVLKNDMWCVTFDGETEYIKDCKPIRYLVRVLRQPHGKPIG